MTHEPFRSNLLELAYGELEPEAARAAEAHLVECAECRAELERIRSTRRAMARLPVEAAPPGGEAALLAAARRVAERQAASRRSRLLPAWAWGGAAGLAVAASVVAISYRLVEWEPRRAADVQETTAFRSATPEPPLEAPRTAMEPAPSTPGAIAAPDVTLKPATEAPAAAPAPVPRRSAPALRGGGALERAESRPALRAEKAAPPPEALAEAPAEATAAATAGAPAEAPEDRAARAAGAPRARQPFPAAAPPTFPAAVQRRTFEDCPGERVREVERDERGRVVRWMREGDLDGRAVRVTAWYGADGSLSRIAVEPEDAAAADAAALGVPSRAAAATLDAPPRCDGER